MPNKIPFVLLSSHGREASAGLSFYNPLLNQSRCTVKSNNLMLNIILIFPLIPLNKYPNTLNSYSCIIQLFFPQSSATPLALISDVTHFLKLNISSGNPSYLPKIGQF